MFSRSVFLLLVILSQAQAQTQVPPAAAQAPAPVNNEVYLVDLGAPAHPHFDGTLINLSNSAGYDNQPSFTPDGAAVLFTSNRDVKQYDIYRYDLAHRTLTQLTHTAESEYSALVTPDGKTFSVIRVEADGAQRLWRFDLDGTNPRLVLENIKPVGYHAWIDATHLALYVLGAGRDPATLQLADTKTGTAEVVATNIGRSIAIRPGGKTVSFVSRQQTPWEVRELDPATHDVRTLLTLPQPASGTSGPRPEDYAWDPSVPGGRVLYGVGTRLLAVTPGAAGTAAPAPEELADFASAGIKNITRLAVHITGGHLMIALVAEPAASPIATAAQAGRIK